MNKLMGKQTVIFLKGTSHLKDKVEGLLFDSDEESVYIRDNDLTIAVLKSNIQYCCSRDRIEYGGGLIDNKPSLLETSQFKSSKKTELQALRVYIDDKLVTTIDVPHDVDLIHCNESVLRLVWTDEVVHEHLRGKVQKSLEYDIGEARIYTVQDDTLDGDHVEENTYSMGSGYAYHSELDILKKAGEKNET